MWKIGLQFVAVLIGIALLVLATIGAKGVTYSLFYEDSVRETVKEELRNGRQ